MTRTEQMVTCADRIARALERHGVTEIFGQSLPSAVILAAEARGIHQVVYRQENMGGAMADAYARCSRQIGVVAAQNGPAATLLVPPLAEALKVSSPVVALVQDVERDQTDRNAFQELDHIALFNSCTKWVRRVTSAERIDDYVDAAFTAAGSGRPGPVALLLPADLLREEAPEPAFPRKAQLGSWPLDSTRPTDDMIEEAAELIAEARQPVIVAGGGVHCARAAVGLARLQEAASLPVFTTNMGKGAVDEYHPLSAGVLGALNGPRSLGAHTRAILEEADVIVLLGTRTNQNGTDSWRLMPTGARYIHIDVDPTEIGRTYEALRLTGDAAPTIRALHQRLQDFDLKNRHAQRPALETRIAAAWKTFEADRSVVAQSSQTPIRPERVMSELQTRLTPQTTVVADASYSSMWVLGQLRALSAGMRFITPRGLAGLGWGLPMALGAKVANPSDPVVVIVGDGGFAHSWAEIETMVRAELPVTVVVLNNSVLGYQKDAETVKFGSYTTACHLRTVDHAAIATACGCPAVRIDDPADLNAALKRGLNGSEPLLIDVMTDPHAHPPLSLFAQMDAAA